MNSYKKLVKAIEKKNTYLCTGLDTDPAKLPASISKDISGILEFNKEIIDATRDYSVAYKVNLAFYERFGSKGIDALYKTFEMLPDDTLSIADAKRGDIGNTAAAYADAVFNDLKADSVTVNPYMGIDTVEPFFEFEDKLVFILALTSNPGSADFQRLISDGQPVYKHVVKKFTEAAPHDKIGFVAGATHPGEISDIRELAPVNVLLIPGIGAQGGDAEAVIKSNNNAPAVINVSRGIIFASNQNDFARKAAEKAKEFSHILSTK